MTKTSTTLAAAGRASILAAVAAVALPASAQTVIYDGSQPLNIFSSSRLNDTLMLNNNLTDPSRNGIVQSGADPNVLEQGDAAWFRTSDRRMNTVAPGTAAGGLAGAAVGVDGNFMTSFWGAGVTNPNGAGAGYVVYDAKATTGLHQLDFSFYYNDATPNSGSTNISGPENSSGGNIAVRVWGIQSSGDLTDPWGTDDFQLNASAGFAGAEVASGQYRNVDGAAPVAELLLFKSSVFDPANPAADIFLPSAEWQTDSLLFNLGSGYDFIFIGFGGVEQNNTNNAGDRYGFDNISFAPVPLPDGDYNGDGIVDAADYTVWRDGNSPDSTQAGYDLWSANYGSSSASGAATGVPEPGAALLLAVACAGCLPAGCRRR